MKARYAIAMFVVSGLAAIFIYVLFVSPFGQNPRLPDAIQSAALFVALIAGIIALSSADPARPRIRVSIVATIEATKELSHDKGSMPKELADLLPHLPSQFISRRISFAITNLSGFAIESPVLSFRLPLDKQHPQLLDGRHTLTFNSNLFNSQSDLRLLDFGDTRILSNSNLPYWNDKETVTIWIRMALSSHKFDPFGVVVSLNAPGVHGAVTRAMLKPDSQSLSPSSA